VCLIILEVDLPFKLRVINVTARNSNMAKNSLCSACFSFSFVLSCSIVISILPFEGGSSRSHYGEKSFWRRLWTRRQTEYWMYEWMNRNLIVADINPFSPQGERTDCTGSRKSKTYFILFLVINLLWDRRKENVSLWYYLPATLFALTGKNSDLKPSLKLAKH
jgi:hypothetical protein